MAYYLSVPADSWKIKDLIMPILIMSLVSFLFNNLLSAAMLASTRRAKIPKLWVKKSFLLILNYAVAAEGPCVDNARVTIHYDAATPEYAALL